MKGLGHGGPETRCVDVLVALVDDDAGIGEPGAQLGEQGCIGLLIVERRPDNIDGAHSPERDEQLGRPGGRGKLAAPLPLP